METSLLFVCVLLAALGCGIVAGAFYAFSTFVMRALAALAPGKGMAAMQSINIVVINIWFMGALFGTAGLCLGLGVWSLLNWRHSAAPLVLGGGLLYLAGTIGVTIICNVPRNNALAGFEPSDPQGASYWARYLREWTFWNHVRTLAAVIAMGLFVVAITRIAP